MGFMQVMVSIIVKMVYNNKNGEKITANYGTYPIEGVVFKDGVAYAKWLDKKFLLMRYKK